MINMYIHLTRILGGKASTYVTRFWKITHMGANDTVNIKLLKAASNVEFLPIYDCNKSLMPKITSRA